MRILDSHVHFWNYESANQEFDWIGEGMDKIKKSFLPKNLLQAINLQTKDATTNPEHLTTNSKLSTVNSELSTINYSCIAVQASETWSETAFLLELAGKNDFIKGVVGWCDVGNYDQLSTLKSDFSSKLKGFRHIIQAKQHGYMSSDGFRYFISKLKNHNYTYDLLIKPNQIEEALELVSEFPNQKFVIDHLAKPDIRNQDFEPWISQIQEFKHLPNVYCKISGMVTEAYWQSWKSSDFKYALDTVFETFGTSRLMYGSDWPVCLLAADYKQVTNIVADYLSELSLSEPEKIFYNNAAEFYNISTKMPLRG